MSSWHLLGSERAPSGEALGEALRRDGVELTLGTHVAAARREGEDYVLQLDDERELRGERLLIAAGRRPRIVGLGLETVGIETDSHGITVDVNGIWPLTSVGKYQGDVVAANILGEPLEWYACSDGQRGLLQPLTGLGADCVGAPVSTSPSLSSVRKPPDSA